MNRGPRPCHLYGAEQSLFALQRCVVARSNSAELGKCCVVNVTLLWPWCILFGTSYSSRRTAREGATCVLEGGYHGIYGLIETLVLLAAFY